MNLLFSRAKIVWKALWENILEGLLVTVGCLLFIVPGIIIGLMYSLSLITYWLKILNYPQLRQ